jgi:hypothetical protein
MQDYFRLRLRPGLRFVDGIDASSGRESWLFVFVDDLDFG